MTKPSRSSTPGGSVRQLRVGENLRHAMADILSRDLVRDPVLAGVTITVSEVEVSPDLRNATVYVYPLLGKNQDEVVAALNRAVSFLRGRLATAVSLKYMPKLEFSIDPSFNEASKIDEILADPRVQRDIHSAALEPTADDDGDAPDPGHSGN